MELGAIVNLTAWILGVIAIIWHQRHITNKFCAEIRAAFDRPAEAAANKFGGGGGGR